MSTITRLSADLVAGADRERIEEALAAMAADGRLPQAVVEQITAQVRSLAAGREVLVVESDAVLTTTQAAAILGCSRPHLTKMCERGEIPCHFVGRDRRIMAEDLLAVLEKREADRARALEFASAHAATRDARVAERAGLSMERARQLGL